MSQIAASLVSLLILLSPVEELKTLLRQGNNIAAYELANEVENQFAGEIEFDFYYGLAALESGHPQYASMAFDRILMLQPDNPRVRLELARTYYVMGDLKAAKAEFDSVLEVKPPNPVVERINVFLDAIEARQKTQDLLWQAQLKWHTGIDSNVNSATNTPFEAVFGPFRATLTPSEDSAKQDDVFNEVALNGFFRMPQSQKSAYFASSQIVNRINSSSSQFDTNSVSLAGGWSYQSNKNQFRFPATMQVLWVDGEPSRNLFNLGTQWSRALNAQRQVSSFLQFSALRYPNNNNFVAGIKQADNHEKDIDQAITGIGVFQNIAAWRTGLNANLLAGVDNARGADAAGNDIYGKTFVTLQGAAQYRPFNRHTLQLRMMLQYSEYEDRDPRFPTAVREDLLTDANIAWRWLMQKKLSFDFTLAYTDNHSNLNNYDYDRTRIFFGAQYQW